MFLRFIGKIIFTLFLLAVTTLSFAKANNDRILCPTPERVQRVAAQINNAFKDSDTMLYFASSPVPAIYYSDLWWYIGVDRIFANSSDEAIKIGRKKAQKTSYQRTKYAVRDMDGLTCFYGPGEIQATVLRK